jgi:hypothetical protein
MAFVQTAAMSTSFGDGPAAEPTLLERFEASSVGRLMLTAFVIFTVGGVIVWNLPGSELRRQAAPIVQPYFNAAGLDQGWGVFAPDPRGVTNDMLAQLDYADGTQLTWRFPVGEPVLAPYRYFRWQKWSEHVSFDEPTLWRPAALWLARTHPLDGQLPVRVTVIERWYDDLAPGAKPARGPWQQRTIGTVELMPSAIAKVGL